MGCTLISMHPPAPAAALDYSAVVMSNFVFVFSFSVLFKVFWFYIAFRFVLVVIFSTVGKCPVLVLYSGLSAACFARLVFEYGLQPFVFPVSVLRRSC